MSRKNERITIMKRLALLLTVALILPCLLFSCSAEKYETVMEYNGIKLTENMYYYWMSTFKRNILSSYSDAKDNDTFWKAKYDDTRTVEDYFTEIINQRIMNYLIAESIFREQRLTLSSDVKNDINNDIKEKIEYYGSRGELNEELKNLMLNIDSLKTVYTWEARHDAVYDYFYGEDGVETVSDSEIIEYYEKNYSRIKYIVFYTTKIKTDTNGNYVYDSDGQLVTEEMTADELEATTKKIEECNEKLKNGAAFDDMIKEYSDFNKITDYPNGFYVSANEISTWGSGIISGAVTANPGEVFRVDEDSAVYLVLKCELTPFENLSNTDTEQLTGLASYATTELYREKFSALSEKVKVSNEILSKYKLSEIKANPYYSF